MQIPDSFRETITSAWGDEGARWLNALPQLIKALAQEWKLEDIEPFSNLSFHYVATASQGDRDVVLKLGLDIERELATLEHYAGRGCVALLEHDISRRALLLEYLNPGTPLREYFPERDEEATRIAANLLSNLHHAPAFDDFPTLEEWLETLYHTGDDIIPHPLLTRARTWAMELTMEPAENVVLLHGDLHHDNILESKEGWKAIDPKGVVGEPGYDIATFIYNPIPLLQHHPNAKAIIAKRLDIFAETLTIDREHLRKLAFIQAILAACWAIEDDLPWEGFVACAEMM